MRILVPNTRIIRAWFDYAGCASQDMKRRGMYGHVINISCLAGEEVTLEAGDSSVYVASKQAVRAVSEGLRMEVSPWKLGGGSMHHGSKSR